MPWLCANNRVDEAERIIRNAAKMNGITMPDRILSVKGADDAAGGDGPSGDKADADGELAATRDGQTGGGKKSSAGSRIVAKFNDLRKLKKSGNKQEEDHMARYTLLDVFRNRRLTIYAISMAFLW